MMMHSTAIASPENLANLFFHKVLRSTRGPPRMIYPAPPVRCDSAAVHFHPRYLFEAEEKEEEKYIPPPTRSAGDSVAVVTFTMRILKLTVCAFSIEKSDKYDHPDRREE